VVAVVAFVSALVPAAVLAAPPTNDYFANATDAYLGMVDELSTSQATLQVNEPASSCGTDIGHTVWYRYIAPDDEDLHADTLASSYDTVLAVYEGTSITALSEVACNDDTSDSSASSVDFAVYSGLTYYIQVAGYQSDSGTLSLYFDVAQPDNTAPTVFKPVPSVKLRSKFGSGSSVVSWGGYDNQSGISYFDLQKSSNGGGWQYVSLPSDTSTSVSISLSLNKSYQFRVRATDNASNTSLWKVGPVFTPVVYQDTARALTYTGRWTRSSDPNSSGGTHTWTRTTGAKVSLSFTGRTVAFIAPTDYHRGRADVIVDGVNVATIDLYSGNAHESVVLFTRDWNTVGSHKITIRNRGTSGRPKIDVDAFLVYQ
jgi:hypothetical protein